MNIAFIGLGHMGTPMVRHFLARNYQVRVFDINEEAMDALANEGALKATSVADAVGVSDVIITIVQTGEQVKNLCEGEGGIFASAKADALYIDSSSIDITTARALHAKAENLGLAMCDAPVSGGVAGAEAGSLTVMVGGTQDVFERAKPILDVYGKTIVHAGPAGNGQVAKICNNMILGITMIGISEAFNLAEQCGLDPKTLYAISSQASGQCWAMTSYAPIPDVVPTSPANFNFEPGFTALMMLKDLNLSQDAAKSANSATPLGEHATALYRHFVDEGHANVDFSGIIRMLRQEDHNDA